MDAEGHGSFRFIETCSYIVLVVLVVHRALSMHYPGMCTLHVPSKLFKRGIRLVLGLWLLYFVIYDVAKYLKNLYIIPKLQVVINVPKRH